MSDEHAIPLEQDLPGVIAYDLRPPASPTLAAYAPLRALGQHRQVPKYVPPPVPDGHARVRLDDDYYLGPGWRDWAEADTSFPVEVFDIPAEQRERWAKAQADYAAMQQEIDALWSARLATPGWTPPGWTLKQPYQPQP